MKNQTKSLIILFLTIAILACSNDNPENQLYLYKSEKLNLTELINNRTGLIARTSDGEDDVIHTELATSFYIPEDLGDVEIENYIDSHQNEISGTLTFIMNEQAIITMVIENGELISINNNRESNNNNNHVSRTPCDNPHDGHCDDDYPLRNECSYDGIQDCVQHAVYEEWSTYYALKCSFTGGLECIFDETVSCIESNC